MHRADDAAKANDGKGLHPTEDTMLPAPEADNRKPSDSNELRVLLVEDNLVNRKLAKKILEKLGCIVDTAENGAEGVRMQAATNYDAVFMDCQMPVMDGFEATERIRARGDDQKRVPIIAVTANVLPDDQIRCYQSGMDDIIAKPISPKDFVESLARWCGFRQPGFE